MSVIVYRAKNYVDKHGDPCDLVHKIYPDGVTKTTYENDKYTITLKKWKEDNNLYEVSHYESDGEETIEQYKNGKLHSHGDDWVYSMTLKKWKKDNNLYEVRRYRSDFENTTERYKNGVLHNDKEEYPAYTSYEDGYTTEILKWYTNGVLHRDHGRPAVVYNYEADDVYRRECWVNGVKVESYNG
jgi:hypothetical protein